MTEEGTTDGLQSEPRLKGEPSLSTIMAAIQDIIGTIEPKLDTVTVDIILLRAVFKKIAEKVTAAKSLCFNLRPRDAMSLSGCSQGCKVGWDRGQA
ncbi:hypothetical protein NDU88_003451 [Pleurodeles waltl]|uniref:Uncharacterized protein n=1 Tax=Pleurodeles waltl TaxID=8319 RepID=A0AAV7M4M5_PLEWA|nr:hypothetical protein NDU88_003451 [Pleurodeles waltl]